MIPDKDFPSVRGYDKPNTRKPCYTHPWRSGALADYQLEGILKDIQGVQTIHAEQLNDKLAQVNFSFLNPSGVNAPTILATLKQRYGVPTKEINKPWISQGGSRTTSLTIWWLGKEVSILFEERGVDVDKGYVTYYTKAWTAHEQSINTDIIKKGASGL